MKLSALVVSAALGIAGAPASAQSTSPRPMQRATDEHQALLMSKAYDKIDQAAEDARAKNLRLSDGQPLLTAIYSGVIGCGCGNQLNDELWQVRKQRLDEWSKGKPESLTARLSVAAFPVKYAWMARGGGYSHTVSPQGWKLFRERTEEGRKALEALDAKTKEDAGWYEYMLEVALAQGWPAEKYDALFFRAVDKYPDYTPFYFSRMNFYNPRWYGSDAEVRRVVEEAVSRTKSQMGETMYARLHWLEMDAQMFKTGRTDWSRMKAGFQQMVKDYPDRWNMNNFAKFSCMAADYGTFVTLLPKLGGPILQAWDNDMSSFARCRIAALGPG